MPKHSTSAVPSAANMNVNVLCCSTKTKPTVCRKHATSQPARTQSSLVALDNKARVVDMRRLVFNQNSRIDCDESMEAERKMLAGPLYPKVRKYVDKFETSLAAYCTSSNLPVLKAENFTNLILDEKCPDWKDEKVCRYHPSTKESNCDKDDGTSYIQESQDSADECDTKGTMSMSSSSKK